MVRGDAIYRSKPATVAGEWTTHGHTPFHSRGSFAPNDESLELVVLAGM